MSGFEPRTSGNGSARSTNWVTTTAPARLFLNFNLINKFELKSNARKPKGALKNILFDGN